MEIKKARSKLEQLKGVKSSVLKNINIAKLQIKEQNNLQEHNRIFVNV